MGDHARFDGLGPCLCLAAILTIGCSQDSATPGGTAGQASVVIPEELPSGEMPSEEEATELAQQIETAMAKQDDSVLRDAIDWNMIFDRGIAGVDAPEEIRRGFRTGFMGSVNQAGGLPGQILQGVQQGGTYRFLRVRQSGGELRALFRMVLSDDSVNYHDMLMVRSEDGRVRIVDMYVLLSAEDVSTTIRRTFVGFVAEQKQSFLERLSGKEAVYGKHVNDLKAMKTHRLAGRYEEVLKIYESLPPTLQADKSILLVRCQAASQIGSADYLQAIRAFRRHHPNDACCDFLSIDLYVSSSEFEKALASLDRVEESVGGDPYLNVLRANCLAMAERFEEAKQAAKAAVEAEPDLAQANMSLLGIALQTNDFAEVTRVLQQLTTHFEVEFEDLTTVPEYAEYVKSPEYQKWLETREQ